MKWIKIVITIHEITCEKYINKIMVKGFSLTFILFIRKAGKIDLLNID